MFFGIKTRNMQTVEEAVKGFLHHCKYEKQLSDKTLKAYGIDLNQFSEIVQTNKRFYMEEVSKLQVKIFLQKLGERHKVKTIKRKIASTKALFNFYEYENDSFINPFRKIRIKMKEPFKIPSVLTVAEVSTILNQMYESKKQLLNSSKYSYEVWVRDIAILELLFATGLRVSELSHLLNDDVDLVQGQIKVTGKGNKERILHFGIKETAEILLEYKTLFRDGADGIKYFFFNRQKKRLTEASIRTIVKKHSSIIDQKVTPHTYRHTFATVLLDEGVDIKHIQHLLGHSSILTTQIYTHVSSKMQKQIIIEKHPRNYFSFRSTEN